MQFRIIAILEKWTDPETPSYAEFSSAWRDHGHAVDAAGHERLESVVVTESESVPPPTTALHFTAALGRRLPLESSTRTASESGSLAPATAVWPMPPIVSIFVGAPATDVPRSIVHWPHRRSSSAPRRRTHFLRRRRHGS